MIQPRHMSAIESGVTLSVGYLLAIVAYQLIWPAFGYEVHVTESATVALLMFPVNYGRQYVVRRAFNWLQSRQS